MSDQLEHLAAQKPAEPSNPKTETAVAPKVPETASHQAVEVPAGLESKTEITAEQAFEQYKEVNDEKPDESPYVIKQASRGKTDDVMTDDVGKSPLLKEYEEVMADGLATSYQSMTPEQQEKFRKKGEEVARQIEDLTMRFKLTARKVLHLLRSWLRLIPGVNKYFLEQESKLKTDEIMKLGRVEMLRRKHE